MKQEILFKEVTKEDLKKLSREDLIQFALGEQELRTQIEKQIHELEEERLWLNEKYIRIKNKLFDRSSEKSLNIKEKIDKPKKEGKKRPSAPRLPSERYPNADLLEKDILIETPEFCKCHGSLVTAPSLPRISPKSMTKYWNKSINKKKTAIKWEFTRKKAREKFNYEMGSS
ncbi:MAG: hypothetical protein HQK49_08085 [Oligoflexia bacterium]|nr:hypothetical protein [Oligoflexia bacterium]